MTAQPESSDAYFYIVHLQRPNQINVASAFHPHTKTLPYLPHLTKYLPLITHSGVVAIWEETQNARWAISLYCCACECNYFISNQAKLHRAHFVFSKTRCRAKQKQLDKMENRMRVRDSDRETVREIALSDLTLWSVKQSFLRQWISVINLSLRLFLWEMVNS